MTFLAVIQTVTTTTLVGITWWYARETQKMAELMKRQRAYDEGILAGRGGGLLVLLLDELLTLKGACDIILDDPSCGTPKNFLATEVWPQIRGELAIVVPFNIVHRLSGTYRTLGILRAALLKYQTEYPVVGNEYLEQVALVRDDIEQRIEELKPYIEFSMPEPHDDRH